MLSKRIKQNEQCSSYIFQIGLNYNNKLIHSSTGFTPNDARKTPNELMTYINMKLKGKKKKEIS